MTINYIFEMLQPYMKQHHTIEIFSANCPLCKHIVEDVEIGRCEGCKQIVYDLNNMTEDVKTKMKNYGVKAVPTSIIDGNIRIVGIPDFPGICGEDLFQKLKRDYTFKKD
jgi:Thioredoxin domain